MLVKDPEIAKAFAARLRQLRAKVGLSQAQLAKLVKPKAIAVQAVARYESGNTAPNIVALTRLAEALGVNPCDLLPKPKKPKR